MFGTFYDPAFDFNNDGQLDWVEESIRYEGFRQMVEAEEEEERRRSQEDDWDSNEF